MQRDLQEALGHGLQGTPAFVINGQALVGFQSFEAFRQVIDPLLGSVEETNPGTGA